MYNFFNLIKNKNYFILYHLKLNEESFIYKIILWGFVYYFSYVPGNTRCPTLFLCHDQALEQPSKFHANFLHYAPYCSNCACSLQKTEGEGNVWGDCANIGYIMVFYNRASPIHRQVFCLLFYFQKLFISIALKYQQSYTLLML